jgi:hypothetical protein
LGGLLLEQEVAVFLSIAIVGDASNRRLIGRMDRKEEPDSLARSA